MKKTLLSLAMLLIGVGAWAQVADGVYTINNTINGRGTMCFGSINDTEYLGLTNITLSGCTNNNVTVENDENKYWYVCTDNGLTYFYNIGKGLFLQNYTGTTNASCAEDASGFSLEEKVENGTDYVTIISEGKYVSFACGWTPSQGQIRHLDYEAAAAALTFTEVENGLTTYATQVATANAAIANVDYLELLTNLFNSFDYQMAYKCLGDAPGQFSGNGDAYKNAYDAAKTAIESESGDFATLKTNLEEAFGNLEYNALETGKYYTIKTKSDERYFATEGRGSTPAVSDDIFIFKLDSNNGLVIYTDNQRYINGLIHARNAGYFSRNKFYYVEDEGMLIHYNEQNFYKVGTSGTLEVVQDIAAIDEACYWVIEEVAPTMAINSDVKYATFYAPVAVTIPDGVSAYYVSATTANSASLTALEGTIPANTGVVLYADAGFSGAPAIVDYVAPTEGNLLSGTVETEDITVEGYVLAEKNDVVGFYKADFTGEKFQNKAGKAYLPASAVTASARFLNFDFGTETAIESIQGAENGAVIYDLAGRRVQNAQKGLYIVNGKKVIK